MKIYLAGPLFQTERDWMRKVKGQIENLAAKPGRQIEVVWPHELITQKEIDELGESANQEIFHRCKSRCNRARHNISLNS